MKKMLIKKYRQATKEPYSFLYIDKPKKQISEKFR